MAKRSVHGYRPLAVAEALRSGPPFFPASAIDAMIAIAGEPPAGPFKISVITGKGKFRSKKARGRTALQHHLEKAAHELARARLDQRRPTARQLEKEFAGIAATARRLLSRLRVGPQHDVKDIPTTLLSGGLMPFAHMEAAKLPRSARSLLEDAVRGVARLADWAEAARRRHEQIAKHGLMRKRNEGDPALDRFVGSVVATCWLLIYGRRITDGPTLIAFVRAALRGVGEKPSTDAVRDRIRRIFRGRGKSKSK